MLCGLLGGSQGVLDCLGYETNHFLVAPVSQHTAYEIQNFINYRINVT
jgi:hypothetical protein